MSLHVFRCVMVLGMLVAPALGQTAGMISVQGLIKDSDGVPIVDPVDLEFAIFDADVGGNLAAGPFGPINVTPNIGVVSTKFGPVDPSVFDGCDPSLPCRWLEVSVDGNALSRIEMVTAPATSEQLNVPASGTPAIRVEPTAGTPNIISGFDGNSVTPGIVGATIGRGVVTGSGGFDLITDDYGTISGGHSNQAGDNDGAPRNPLAPTIGGGTHNLALDAHSTVGGGFGNEVSGARSTVAGGNRNATSGTQSSIGGGDQNVAGAAHATIAGGRLNISSADSSTVGGGKQNIAGGRWSTVPGGRDNTAAGDYSFAVRRRAKANHEGTYGWADSEDADFASTGNDQFLIQAAGGVGIGTNSPRAPLHVVSDDSCVIVESTVTGGSATGVRVTTQATAGSAVSSRARAETGNTYGVNGQSDSTSGVGVRGYAPAASGNTIGVSGFSASPNGYAGYFVGRGYVSGYLAGRGGSPLFMTGGGSGGES